MKSLLRTAIYMMIGVVTAFVVAYSVSISIGRFTNAIVVMDAYVVIDNLDPTGSGGYVDAEMMGSFDLSTYFVHWTESEGQSLSRWSRFDHPGVLAFNNEIDFSNSREAPSWLPGLKCSVRNLDNAPHVDMLGMTIDPNWPIGDLKPEQILVWLTSYLERLCNYEAGVVVRDAKSQIFSPQFLEIDQAREYSNNQVIRDPIYELATNIPQRRVSWELVCTANGLTPWNWINPFSSTHVSDHFRQRDVAFAIDLSLWGALLGVLACWRRLILRVLRAALRVGRKAALVSAKASSHLDEKLDKLNK